MGAVLAALWRWEAATVDVDLADPVTSLTPRERKHVTDTWRLVQRDVKGNGVALFISYFEAYPDAQRMFPGFADVPLEALRTSKRLQAHANGVMYAFTGVVENLDDPECLQEMLSTLGKNHARRRVTERHFQDLKKILLSVLKGALGSTLTTDVEASWSKTIDVAYRGIFRGMNEAKSVQ